ncbi:MAG: hypothetical protein E6529_05570 [[Ruminococcus] lactaris]|uniref:hypothetical protein n=1 Tax=[Ruminococcus] lactaris TaxID=46228 RepID=UPI00290C8DF0|nr:hypothetical protein [[Ruminococcus] lactaris]MDU6470315.1 hypothetical protein [[Ruminococcus] lactaris]
MLGSKAPNNDANGLFRATHSHNPTRYSHIMVLTPHFYAHIGAGLKVILPPVCKKIVQADKMSNAFDSNC